MAAADQGNTTGRGDEAEDINTPGTGNTDLTGQAREIVEASEEGGPTGPTPGGG